MDYYIHQIGNMNDKNTYERLAKILESRMIASRSFLEKNGIQFDQDNSAFKLDIPEGKEWMYYEDDIHKDRVSLSDPENRFIKKAIEQKDHQFITCFDYDYIAIAISREVPVVPKEQLVYDTIGLIIDKISEICNQNDFPLDIYNYEGELLKERTQKKIK